MPNHIKNKMTIHGPKDGLDALLNDFGTFHPRCERKAHNGDLIYQHKDNQYDYGWLNKETGKFSTRGKDGMVHHDHVPEGYEQEFNVAFVDFPDFRKLIPPPDNDAYNDKPNQATVRNSPNWWYSWNLENWGTKWGGYSHQNPEPNVFSFETAWSTPRPIWAKIADIIGEYRIEKIEVIYADEDYGYNCGRITITPGKVEIYNPVWCSKEAYEIVFEAWPGSSDNYELIDGQYQYKYE